MEKGVSRRLQAARLRVGPPEPHADNTCRGGWGRPRGRRGRGGRAPGGPAPAARRRAATSEAAGGEGWITRSRGDRDPAGEGGLGQIFGPTADFAAAIDDATGCRKRKFLAAASASSEWRKRRDTGPPTEFRSTATRGVQVFFGVGPKNSQVRSQAQHYK